MSKIGDVDFNEKIMESTVRGMPDYPTEGNPDQEFKWQEGATSLALFLTKLWGETIPQETEEIVAKRQAKASFQGEDENKKVAQVKLIGRTIIDGKAFLGYLTPWGTTSISVQEAEQIWADNPITSLSHREKYGYRKELNATYGLQFARTGFLSSDRDASDIDKVAKEVLASDRRDVCIYTEIQQFRDEVNKDTKKVKIIKFLERNKHELSFERGATHDDETPATKGTRKPRATASSRGSKSKSDAPTSARKTQAASSDDVFEDSDDLFDNGEDPQAGFSTIDDLREVAKMPKSKGGLGVVDAVIREKAIELGMNKNNKNSEELLRKLWSVLSS